MSDSVLPELHPFSSPFVKPSSQDWFLQLAQLSVRVTFLEWVSPNHLIQNGHTSLLPLFLLYLHFISPENLLEFELSFSFSVFV